jgi:hypothetical protein
MRALTGAALFLTVFLVGCDEKPEAPAGTPSALAAPSAAPEPPKPWYFGKWTGDYDARLHPIEMSPAEGAVADWKKDDGGSHSGPGKLEISVDEAGLARVSATGPLGSLYGEGKVEDEVITVHLTPETPSENAFFGVLALERKGQKLAGSLQASGRNSKVVRHADVVLEKPSGGG